ncbi:MAG: YdeI/OmpD-associated family protein [Rhodocyclaceae bacterium]|nr:YdeI/OmpD-associated family protein [Rhodocyclaceae bacterium]
MTDPIVVQTKVARKAETLPRYVVIPARDVAVWCLVGTTPVEVAVGGVQLGRRNLKRWGKGRDCWFLDLPSAWCRRAGIDSGQPVTLHLRRASDALPVELSNLLASNPSARMRWHALSASRQRAFSDHVRAARQPATRARRAAALLASDTS